MRSYDIRIGSDTYMLFSCFKNIFWIASASARVCVAASAVSKSVREDNDVKDPSLDYAFLVRRLYLSETLN